MKTRLIPLLCLLLCAALLAGCQFSPAPSSTADTLPVEPTTQASVETTPPATTAGSESGHVEITNEVLIQMLDEAAEMLESNDTLVLPYSRYLHSNVGSCGLLDAEVVSVDENTITVFCNKNPDYYDNLQFLILMSNLLEYHPNCWLPVKASDDTLISLCCGYEKAGCSSMQEFEDVTYDELQNREYPNFFYEGRTTVTLTFQRYIFISTETITEGLDLFTADYVYIFDPSSPESSVYHQHLKDKE